MAAIALCLTVSPVIAYGASRALFHAALLRSTPAANSHLAKVPESIRLVFSEAIVADLSRVSLIGADGKTIQLQVATDPHDVHTLVGRVGAISSGRYKVAWHVLSADGHPVGGTFEFTVGSASDSAVVGTTTKGSIVAAAANGSTRNDTSSTASSTATTEVRTVPVVASVLRGTGLAAMMAAVGLLFFGVTGTDRRSFVPGRLVVWLTAIGAILLAAHLLAWLQDISPTGSLNSNFIGSALGSTPGTIEAIRVGLALLTLWAVALARRGSLALALGVCCLAISGAIGHPAAIHPALTIPSKAVHLLAGAAWLGGLLRLVVVVRRDDANFPLEARRVSSIALVCVIAIFFSGMLQTWLFLNAPGDLIHSAYGRLALLKMIGLIVLIGFGASNRIHLLPVIEDGSARSRLSRSVTWEIAIVTALILIGGFLAYVPTPLPPGTANTLTGASR